MTSDPPDYYTILSIPSTATPQQIRDAYKKAALKSHPDRVPSDSPERPLRTKKFQQINDAYYTLSDPARRRDYDTARTFHFNNADSTTTDGDDGTDDEFPHHPNTNTGSGAGAGRSSFPWSAFGFGSGSGSTSTSPSQNPETEADFSSAQFGSVFEEMLRDEGLAEGHDARPTGKFWSLVGGLSGGAMGFIVANFPGAIAGAVAGNRLGAVRDARGKSVYAVFQELPQGDKARLLSQLAGRVFATVAGGSV